MSVSMNKRIAGLVDAVADDPEATETTVVTLDSGARVIDCGADARGGLNAGLVFASACLGGFGRVEPAPVRVGDRTWPGVGVSVDRPAAGCLASQYAGWKLEHEKFFAMASGPGRALARAEPLFDELAWREPEDTDVAILCLETSQTPPAAVCSHRHQRKVECHRSRRAYYGRTIRQELSKAQRPPTINLARMLASRGQRTEARATLAEIYNWFTEGFDTADLKDAKALLEELGA